MIGMNMTRLISKIFFLFLALALTSCEKQIVPEAADADNVVLTFTVDDWQDYDTVNF